MNKLTIDGNELVFFNTKTNEPVKNIELRGWGYCEYSINLKDYILTKKRHDLHE